MTIIFVILGGVVFFFIAVVAMAVTSGSMMSVNLEKVSGEKLALLAKATDFSPDYKYVGSVLTPGVAIDPSRRKLAFFDSIADPRVYSFGQLVAVEVVRDEQTITSTKSSHNMTGAAIGTALVGPLGMALGASTKSVGKTEDTVDKLALKFYVSDIVSPVHEVAFFHAGIAKPKSNSFVVTSAAKEMDEWYGRFRAILAGQQKDSPWA